MIGCAHGRGRMPLVALFVAMSVAGIAVAAPEPAAKVAQTAQAPQAARGATQASQAAQAPQPAQAARDAQPALVPPSSQAAPSQDGSGAMQQGIAAYQAAQEIGDRDQRLAAFARAERLLRAAAEQGAADADLWANVGTAALQAEHLGQAVVAYRRALVLDPDHRRARQNIEHARTLLPPWVPRPEGEGLLDSFFEWHRAMAAGERAGAAAIAFALAAMLLGAGIARRSAMLRMFSLMPAVAWALLLASLVIGSADENGGAVIVGDDTVARAADSRNAPARFAEALPAGTEVRVAENRGEWSRIVLADGRDAWVPSSSVERIGR